VESGMDRATEMVIVLSMVMEVVIIVMILAMLLMEMVVIAPMVMEMVIVLEIVIEVMLMIIVMKIVEMMLIVVMKTMSAMIMVIPWNHLRIFLTGINKTMKSVFLTERLHWSLQWLSTKKKRLANTKNDGNQITAFLISCGFTVTHSHDEVHTKVEERFLEIKNILLNNNNTKPEKILVFVYYSGHGELTDGLTEGKDIKENLFKLEENIRNIATIPNCVVLSLIDCCRLVKRKKKEVR